MTIFDFIGLIGVLLILVAYALIQLDRVDVKHISYSVMNAVGAGLILISLSIDFNLSAAVIEGAWLVISLFGIIRAYQKRKP
ncbi:MAG: hypothetical protein KDF58_04445 [Alphaproteobacteria bacterium]|nr:hypothetical protein [Alphaproteobacteria bacterium]HPF45285.1 hypothetical protein [Emcibacteraceae bacterium]HRW28992.1 hypothetical protein [Emcibacteraceae bacterium]